MKGFTMYVKCLSSMLHAHHLTEDELTFPYFQRLLPDASFETLSAQHQETIP